MKKYYKNFIMCGDVDFYCLLCEETFHVIDDVEKHIRWEHHRRLIKNQVLVSKFCKEFVYKIGNKFYCEICNFVTDDVTFINAHIKDNIHAFNKANPNMENEHKLECKKHTEFVIVSDIIVSKGEWNAVLNRKCLLCNVVIDISELDGHVTSSDHIIRLIQAKVVRENDDRCYRKINPDIVYCFICKNTVPTGSLSEHWDEEEHTKNTQISINRTLKYIGERNKQHEILRKLMERQKLQFDINSMPGKALCKLCQAVVDLKFALMMKHHAGHASDKKEVATAIDTSSDEEVEVRFSEVTDHGKRRAELKEYGKRHNIKLNEGGSKGYCSICNTQISANKKMFKMHVKGWQHRGLLEHQGLKKEKKREKGEYTTKPISEHLDIVFHSPTLQVLWLNAEICVGDKSFLLIAPLKDGITPRKKMLCFACNIEFNSKDAETHLKTAEHKTKMLETKVVSSPTILREFIREVRPNLYHCGFCNMLIPYFENIHRHFRNWIHRKQIINKDLSTKVAQDWYSENIVVNFSTDPDILYLQLMAQVYLGELPKRLHIFDS